MNRHKSFFGDWKRDTCWFMYLRLTGVEKYCIIVKQTTANGSEIGHFYLKGNEL